MDHGEKNPFVGSIYDRDVKHSFSIRWLRHQDGALLQLGGRGGSIKRTASFSQLRPLSFSLSAHSFPFFTPPTPSPLCF